LELDAAIPHFPDTDPGTTQIPEHPDKDAHFIGHFANPLN
jgi:hypothetical protein